LRTSVLAGILTDTSGGVTHEAAQGIELRRFELIGGMLRIWQSDDSYLDFARAE
jgi:hypothetical protein